MTPALLRSIRPDRHLDIVNPALFAIWKGRGLRGGREDRLPAVVEGESVSRAA